jgi:hypothetical protein
MTQVAREVFGVNFEELFMSSLIEDRTLKKILAIAEKAFEEKDYTKCVQHADAAFNEALSMQRERFGFSIFSVREEMVEVLADKVMILALGIDYIEYAKYRKIIPFPYGRWDGEKASVRYVPTFAEVFPKQGKIPGRLQSREAAFFSLSFVLNCILRWHM